jgi:hypothetical protein
MVIEQYLPLILAAIISITYYYSNRYNIKHKEWNKRIVSFSAGVSITYVLLELFPTFTEGALILNKLLFLAIPIGFITHHIIEKEIYKHNRSHELIKMLSLEEQIFSFCYHLIIGFVLVFFVKADIFGGILFLIPMMSYTFLSNLPTDKHHSRTKAVLLSGSTIFGVLIGVLVNSQIPIWVNFMLIGLVTGILLYTIIRHHIPFGAKGKLGYFTLSFFIYSIMIVISWYI